MIKIGKKFLKIKSKVFSYYLPAFAPSYNNIEQE